MAESILIDEFHLSVFALAGLQSEGFRVIRRALNNQRFREGLRRAIRGIFGRYPSLRKTNFTLTR